MKTEEGKGITRVNIRPGGLLDRLAHPIVRSEGGEVTIPISYRGGLVRVVPVVNQEKIVRG